MAKGFAILRTKRITNINQAFNHNLRVDKRYSRHADETKTDDNLILFDKNSILGVEVQILKKELMSTYKKKDICQKRHEYKMY